MSVPKASIPSPLAGERRKGSDKKTPPTLMVEKQPSFATQSGGKADIGRTYRDVR